MQAPLTWQRLVNDHMLAPQNCTHAVIYQIDSRMLLASSPCYWFPSKDLSTCLDVFDNPNTYLINNLTLFAGTEAEMTFLVCKADERSFYAKRGATSCFGARSNNILVVTFSEPPVLPGRSANLVEILVDMLKQRDL